jgi:hypothetical protein
MFKKVVLISLATTAYLLAMENGATPKNRGCLNQLQYALFIFFESAGQQSLHRYSHIHRQQLMISEKHSQIKNNLKKNN